MRRVGVGHLLQAVMSGDDALTKIKVLRRQGKSLRAIAGQVGCSVNTALPQRLPAMLLICLSSTSNRRDVDPHAAVQSDDL